MADKGNMTALKYSKLGFMVIFHINGNKNVL